MGRMGRATVPVARRRGRDEDRRDGRSDRAPPWRSRARGDRAPRRDLRQPGARPDGEAGLRAAAPDVGSPIDLPSSFSFPSGHATTGIAVFGLLGLYAAILARTRGWKVAAVLAGLALGVLIGVSRIVLNLHFVGDVLAGFCLGLSWLVACLLVTDMIRR
jgi:membrane-associated phospholipid phosphatase